MKKIILTAPFLLVLATAFPAWTEEAHHNGTNAGPVVTLTDTEKLEVPVQKSKRGESEVEEPSRRHERQMKGGMGKMDMMTGRAYDMDTGNMPMADCMAMMHETMMKQMN